MKLIDKTLADATQNVALDEALLLEAEKSRDEAGVLRIWEPTDWVVVVGRGSSVSREVELARCEDDGLPVIRRSSGGATIVAGPGCLFYAVVLSLDAYPSLRQIDQAHAFVLSRLVSELKKLVPALERKGTSDLAIGDHKVSGNSLRCRKSHLLYHGTLLYNMPLDPLTRYLRFPPRQPDYRQGRSHADFVCNLKLSRDVVKQAVLAAWDHPTASITWPQEMTETLVSEKYSAETWNQQIP